MWQSGSTGTSTVVDGPFSDSFMKNQLIRVDFISGGDTSVEVEKDSRSARKDMEISWDKDGDQRWSSPNQ